MPGGVADFLHELPARGCDGILPGDVEHAGGDFQYRFAEWGPVLLDQHDVGTIERDDGDRVGKAQYVAESLGTVRSLNGHLIEAGETDIGDVLRAGRVKARHSGSGRYCLRRGDGLFRAGAPSPLQCRGDEPIEQRVRVVGPGLELGVELRADEKWMTG